MLNYVFQADRFVTKEVSLVTVTHQWRGFLATFFSIRFSTDDSEKSFTYRKKKPSDLRDNLLEKK